MKNVLHYLATPIKHEQEGVVQDRYFQNIVAYNALRMAGIFTYSPMLHHFDVKQSFSYPNDWQFWRDVSLWMVDRCDALIVLQLKGWDKSEGVKAEVTHAWTHGKPILFMANQCMATLTSPSRQTIESFISVLAM